MLMRWDPFREIDRLTQSVGQGARVPAMPMDAFRQGEQFIVNFDLPGVDPGSIDLSVEKNVLTVSAQRSFERAEGQEVLVAERPQGSFTRQLFLGEGLNSEGVKANYDKGVLTLTIPVAEQAKPRRVEVTSSEAGSQPIDTGATDTGGPTGVGGTTA